MAKIDNVCELWPLVRSSRYFIESITHSFRLVINPLDVEMTSVAKSVEERKAIRNTEGTKGEDKEKGSV